MEAAVVDQAEVCQGAVRTRQICGVQTELAVLVGVLTLGPGLAFGSWWLAVPLLPLWLFLRYQTRRDPQFVGVWIGNLTVRPHYEA